jgi:hypothetical protein
MKPIQQTFLAFAASALAGIALRSRDLFVVDGATRCLTVFQNPTLLFHPNNHLLYPVNVLLWTRIVSAVGFNLSQPLSFVLAVATMNCLAAAVCIAILFWIILHLTRSWKLAAIVCLAYGLTTAFLAQALNSNEPMVGAAWSFLGILFAILALRNRKLWPIVLSGLLFALAMATYRSMVFLAPAAAVILISSAGAARLSRATQFARLATLGISFVAGCAAIFGWAYTHMGVRRAAMLAKFLRQEDSSAYFDASPLQLVKLPLGLVRDCFPILPGFNGMRGFLAGPKSVLVLVTLLVVVLWFCLFFCAYTLAKRWNSLHPVERTAVLVSLVGLLFTMIPILTWNPFYGKFWIQPLACISVLVAIAFRQFSLLSRPALIACRAAGLFFLLCVSLNLAWAIPNRFHQAFEFEEARKVTQFVGDKDFVVLDRGADSVSVLYANLWANESHFLPLMDVACVAGNSGPQKVDDAIRRTRAVGGKVFFLGLLDLPKPTWDVFLGAHCGVPYERFDRYRSAAHLRAQFQGRTGAVSLWELEFPSSQ